MGFLETQLINYVKDGCSLEHFIPFPEIIMELAIS